MERACSNTNRWARSNAEHWEDAVAVTRAHWWRLDTRQRWCTRTQNQQCNATVRLTLRARYGHAFATWTFTFTCQTLTISSQFRNIWHNWQPLRPYNFTQLHLWIFFSSGTDGGCLRVVAAVESFGSIEWGLGMSSVSSFSLENSLSRVYFSDIYALGAGSLNSSIASLSCIQRPPFSLFNEPNFYISIKAALNFWML